jgi:hypothetical protein
MQNWPPFWTNKIRVTARPRCLHQHLNAFVEEEFVLFRRLDVLLQRVHDVCVDVILRGARRVICRRFFAVDRPPGIHGPSLIELARPFARFVQHPVPEPQQIFGDARRSVGQKRQYINFRVPEVMSFVGGSGQSLRGHAGVFRPCAGLQHMKEIESQGLLNGRRRGFRPIGIGYDLDVAPVPEILHEPFLAG